MSSWRYQVFRHRADSGETYLAVHEFYTTHDKKESWTMRPVPLEAETEGALRTTLARIMLDMERHGVRDFESGTP